MVNSAQLARTDINLLVLFDVVFRERHLGRAAHRLNLTASAISHGLARLRRVLNDPLFLRNPRGVVPTARALELAEPVADILARVGAVMSSAQPFDARHSQRRFVIGALDALSAIFLPALVARVRRLAPGVDLAIKEAVPEASAMNIERAWDLVRAQLEARTLDVAVVPAARTAPRIVRKKLYDTQFVIAARRGHPFLRRPTLDGYCGLDHLVVSQVGEARGFVDAILARHKRTRRVALTVPSFMLALTMVANSDFVLAAPRNLVKVHGRQLGLGFVDPPFAIGTFDPAYALASNAALLDAGVAWLFAQFDEIQPATRG